MSHAEDTPPTLPWLLEYSLQAAVARRSVVLVGVNLLQAKFFLL